MVTSLTIVRYKPYFIPFALFAMAIHRLPLMLTKGCSFWKLLGTGKNGTFDLAPDWQQWGLLAVWQDEAEMNQFFTKSFIKSWWKIFCKEVFTIYCQPLQARGKWDDKEPFGALNGNINPGEPIAVLTRATIKLNRLRNFWKHVDDVALLMRSAPGYVTSVGIGEAPVYRQATFSVWRSADDMKAFAYKSVQHAEVIRKTHSEGWYSEELFARFKIVGYNGTMNGQDPLKNLFKEYENNSRTTSSRI